MSKDTIYREDAIKAINLRARIPHDVASAHYASMAINAICSVPSADRWIPCSERLPEYRKLVLVTTRDLRVKPAYLDSIQDDGTDDWWNIPLDDADCALWNIVAWMPLPEPWKGASDD